MIVSHKYKFIFIKTHKTAGTSIEVFLSPLCGEEDIVTRITPHVEPHRPRNWQISRNPFPKIIASGGKDSRRAIVELFRQKNYFNHASAAQVKNRLPDDIWNSYFKFCVERNPWDKSLSHFHMVNEWEGGNLTLPEYVERGEFPQDHGLYTDANGQLLVDRVLRYEALNEELGSVFNELGVPFDGSLGVKAKSGARKDKTPYQQIFTPEQAEVIGKAFSPEVRLHGYTF